MVNASDISKALSIGFFDSNYSKYNEHCLRSGGWHLFHFFLFILVYFSAHDFSIVNSLRQLRHDAGGFSYKSMRTLRELFPLLNFGCKYCQIAHTKNIQERYGYGFENLAHKKGYSVYHSNITAMKKNWKDEGYIHPCSFHLFSAARPGHTLLLAGARPNSKGAEAYQGAKA